MQLFCSAFWVSFHLCLIFKIYFNILKQIHIFIEFIWSQPHTIYAKSSDNEMLLAQQSLNINVYNFSIRRQFETFWWDIRFTWPPSIRLRKCRKKTTKISAFKWKKTLVDNNDIGRPDITGTWSNRYDLKKSSFHQGSFQSKIIISSNCVVYSGFSVCLFFFVWKFSSGDWIICRCDIVNIYAYYLCIMLMYIV